MTDDENYCRREINGGVNFNKENKAAIIIIVVVGVVAVVVVDIIIKI